MSLHLGNLSSRIRSDELLRVFERFGQCTLRVKDKFGFVIFEYPANAEEALRTLRGQKICGELITLAWSNRQPRLPQRHTKGCNTYEASQGRGRQYGREYFSNKNLGSDSQDDKRRGFRAVNRSNERVESAELTSYGINTSGGNLEDKRHDFAEVLPDEGGGLETNLLDNDRCGEQAAGNGLASGLDFDRYEPSCGDHGNDQEDILTSTHLEGSSCVRESQEKYKTNQIDQPTVKGFHNSKSQKSCYLCGEVGHRLQNCPQDVKNLLPKSEGQLFLDADASSTGKPIFHKEASRSQRKPLGYVDSPVGEITHGVRKREDQGNKRSRIENASPERRESKKRRNPLSSSIRSDYTASRSQSLSRSGIFTSGSHSHSRSKSIPSEINFMDFRSRSTLTPSDPKSKTLKSSSKLRSCSPTSPCQPLLLSPSKVQTNQQDPSVIHSDLEPEETSDHVEPVLIGDALSDMSNVGIVKPSTKIGISPLRVDENVTENHSLRRNNVGNYSIAGDICETKKSCIPQSEYSGHNVVNLSQKSLGEISEFKRNDLVEDDKSVKIQNSGIEASGRLHTADVINISYKELCMVLKNSGLDYPDENEKDLCPGLYFGSARLWPWEIIYYRRLKKGPISKENYARRLAQNEEFGIVDKYIRSSSGWGDVTDENHDLF